VRAFVWDEISREKKKSRVEAREVEKESTRCERGNQWGGGDYVKSAKNAKNKPSSQRKITKPGQLGVEAGGKRVIQSLIARGKEVLPGRDNNLREGPKGRGRTYRGGKTADGSDLIFSQCFQQLNGGEKGGIRGGGGGGGEKGPCVR